MNRLVAQNEPSGSLRRYPGPVADDLPMDTSQPLFHFNEDALAYAGYYVHNEVKPLHMPQLRRDRLRDRRPRRSSVAVRRQRLSVGDVILLRPGVWHGYDQCQRLTLYNCCFSSELLRGELAWTREDPMLGYLLWTGPYSAQGHGMLTIHLDPGTFEECQVHLAALAALRHSPAPGTAPISSGRLSLLLSILGRAAAETSGPLPGPAETARSAVGQAMRLLETRLADHWTLTS